METFSLIVANAAHIKNVPGRKTDMNDAMWIADLLACGLIQASFVPEEDVQELRSLMRTRKQLGARADAACAADPEDARRGQHPTGLGTVRHHGRERTADHRGDDCGRAQSAPAGGAGQRADQGDAEAAVRRAAWAADGSSPISAEASSATVGWPGCHDPGDRSGSRGADRARWTRRSRLARPRFAT